MLTSTLHHTKTNQLRNIFIEKLRRNVTLKNPNYVKIKDQHNCYFIIFSVQYSEKILHAVTISNLIVVLILMVITSFQATLEEFVTNVNYNAVIIIKIVCLFICILSLLIKCTNRNHQIQQNYHCIHTIILAFFNSGLFFDFISLILLIATLILPHSMEVSGCLFIILIFVLFFAASNLIKIEASYLRSQKKVIIWEMLKVCLWNIIVAHILATILLAMSLLNKQRNWMTKIEIDKQNWQIKYFYSLYWGTTIMMTVGFGDITPNNNKEILITTFVQMFSVIVLAYNISYIGSMISKIKEKDDVIKKKLVIFQRMVKYQDDGQENVSKRLQKKITNYIKQLNDGENTLQFQLKKQLLSQLPDHLRTAYQQEANKRIFSQVPFFKDLKQSTIQLIASKFQSKFYYPGENLFQANQKIMILQIGVVGYSYKKKGSKMNDIIFDEISVKKQKGTQLLTPWFLSLYRIKNHGYIAKVYSIAWIVDIEDLLDSLKTSSMDYQHYFSILHKHTINQSQWNSLECKRCSNQQSKYYHIIFDCPRIVYSPIRQAVIFKYLSLSLSQPHQRKIYFARKRNLFTKISVYKHKKKLTQFLQKHKKIFNYISNSHNQQDQLQRYEAFKRSSKLLSILSSSDNRMIALNDQNFFLVIQKAIMKFETGYEDGFWDIEADIAFNYNYYFPYQNPNRLIQSPFFEPFLKIPFYG